MPSAIVEVCWNYSEDEETRILTEVHEAIVEAFRVAPSHRNVTLVVHKPHRFLGKTDSPNLAKTTNVSIFCLPGRSLEAKRFLYRSIVERLEKFQIPKECVLVRVNELQPENFGVRGGFPITDIELGYSSNI